MTLVQSKFDLTFTGALLSSGVKRGGMPGILGRQEGAKMRSRKIAAKQINSLTAGTHADTKACLSFSTP